MDKMLEPNRQKNLLLACSLVFCCAFSGCSVLFGEKKREGVQPVAPNQESAAEILDKMVVSGSEMSVVFKSPNAAITAQNSVDIEVEIKGAGAAATWNLYYSASASDLSGAVQILSDIGPDKTTAVWDTSFVDKGTYYLLASIKDGDKVSVFRCQCSIALDTDASNPITLVLTSPMGNSKLTDSGDVYAGGEVVDINFSATSTSADPITIKIEYSADGGTTWSAIAENLPATDTTYQWTLGTNLTQTTKGQIRLTATDGTNDKSVSSPGNFGVTQNKAALTYAGGLATVFTANCATAGCHAGGTPAGGITLTDFNGVNANKVSSVTRTRPGAASPMPPSGTLADADRDVIQLWMWLGAQN